METVLREVRQPDLMPLLEFYLHLHETEAPRPGPETAALWQSILDDPDYHLLVAEADGRLCSSVTLNVIKNLTRGCRPYALIENVVTHPDYRGQGLATALLDRAFACARAAGCYKAMLLTGSKKPETLRFYERAGMNSRDKTAFVKWL